VVLRRSARGSTPQSVADSIGESKGAATRVPRSDRFS
jgi:hypothetical protein